LTTRLIPNEIEPMTIRAVKPGAAIPQVTITGEGNAGPKQIGYFDDMGLHERKHARFLEVTPVSTCVSKVRHVFPAFLGKRLAKAIVNVMNHRC